ncbi:MAG: putative toxin-antitoxin system toxin component, PIN family [Gammaproteobacteria bacterium]|nr:putative toxin-antitoxin system toxin component, PIN family [Gammaproteobacteria bacterium]
MSPRIVFDTNTVASALLFPTGCLAWLRQSWHSRTVIPLVNKATMQELYRILCHLKFSLAAAEREELLCDYLPFAELVTMPVRLPALPQCRDSHDQKFIELAFYAKADMLVTGNKDLLVLANKVKFLICNPVICRDRLMSTSKA